MREIDGSTAVRIELGKIYRQADEAIDALRDKIAAANGGTLPPSVARLLNRWDSEPLAPLVQELGLVDDPE